MTAKERNTVVKCLESSGFDYSFTTMCSFEDLADEKFQKLRKNYVEARKQLADYLGYEY